MKHRWRIDLSIKMFDLINVKLKCGRQKGEKTMVSSILKTFELIE